MDKLNIDQHISKQYNDDLEDLKTQFLEMGGLVETQISDAVKAITKVDVRLAEKVIATEEKVDLKEVELDDATTRIIATRQPTASDLRLLLSISKATGDLERMGDEAKKIADMAMALGDKESNKATPGLPELRNLGRNVQQMVNDALTCFARYDEYSALQVARDDKGVDREYNTALREQITHMMEDPRNISRFMNVIWALRSLERIGDHASNIAEYVIYLVRGTDVRHKTTSEMQEELHQHP